MSSRLHLPVLSKDGTALVSEIGGGGEDDDDEDADDGDDSEDDDELTWARERTQLLKGNCTN